MRRYTITVSLKRWDAVRDCKRIRLSLHIYCLKMAEATSFSYARKRRDFLFFYKLFISNIQPPSVHGNLQKANLFVIYINWMLWNIIAFMKDLFCVTALDIDFFFFLRQENWDFFFLSWKLIENKLILIPRKWTTITQYLFRSFLFLLSSIVNVCAGKDLQSAIQSKQNCIALSVTIELLQVCQWMEKMREWLVKLCRLQNECQLL